MVWPLETPQQRNERACAALQGEWQRMQQQNRERARVERERLSVLWGDKEIGQGVLLNWRDSGEILQVSDGEGCQIRLDGVLEEKEGEWGSVRVLLESKKHGMPVMSVRVRVRAEDLERCDGIHVWSKFGARRIDKQRSGEDPDSSPFWGEM